MKYQNSFPDGTAQCLICPRTCHLSNGERGFCQIRQNIDGAVQLLSYGYTTGLGIDPIEKKPLYHFYPGTKVLSFGTRGCNLGCLFCQNWQISKSSQGKSGLQQADPGTIARTAAYFQCRSVAFTYNEPTVFWEYALDTAKECKQRGIKTVSVTAGYINPEPCADLYQYIDAVNVDLKGFRDDFYRRNCQACLDRVLETILYLKKETDVWLELTTLLIEGENDSEEDLKAECDWILNNLGDSVPLHFSAFHPAWKFSNRAPTQLATLVKARQIAKTAGLKHVYTGNLPDEEGSATYCEHCGKPIITRTGFQIESNQIDTAGKCRFCSSTIAGRF